MESTSRFPDEELKRLMGAPDPIRNEEAYTAHINKAEEMQAHFAKNYLQPSEIDISSQRVKRFLKSDDIVMIVPMRERGPVTRPMLSVIAHLMPIHHVYVIDDDSDEAACEEVRRYGARLIAMAEILNILHWDRLLPILGLEERPRGKGVAVCAGYLLLYLLAEYAGEMPTWVCQHDSEIADYFRYRGLEHLAWGALQRRGAHYVKMAKTGRGNERCMSARSLLCSLATLQKDPAIKKRTEDLFMKLGPHKWMLTGEFMLQWSLAMQRPFATGYLEETLISTFAEDVGAVIGTSTVQVSNPHPRLDAANTEEKETLMQDQISSFIMELAHEVLPTNRWTLEDITRLNHERMSLPQKSVRIPDNDGPVRYREVENNRILPSIAMLSEGEFINREEVSSFIEHFLAETAP